MAKRKRESELTCKIEQDYKEAANHKKAAAEVSSELVAAFK
jgi:hypothetical protein